MGRLGNLAKKAGKVARRISPELGAGGGVALGIDLSRSGGGRPRGKTGPARPKTKQRSRGGRGA